MSTAVSEVIETIPVHKNGLATSVAMTPMQMLNAAIDRGDDLDKLERLMDLNDRWEKAQAQKAFIEAKAAFKAKAPTIFKDKTNKQYGSKYASIDNVVSTLNAAMAPYGLDADWSFEQGERIKVTCTLTHVMGHKESRSLSGMPDKSGSKNPLQEIKSTLTYLKLATYEAVTGIATKEGNLNDDGNASGGGLEPITGEQAEELGKLISETGTNLDKFLEVARAESVSDVLAKDYAGLVAKLNLKKKNLSKGSDEQ